LRRVAHSQVHVGCRLAGIERHDLAKAPDRLVVLALVPGDVAELAEALDVAGMALERRERLALVHRPDPQRELDPLVLGIELESLAIFAGPLLELAAPVGQVPAKDVARDAPLNGQTLADSLLLLGGIGGGEGQER